MKKGRRLRRPFFISADCGLSASLLPGFTSRSSIQHRLIEKHRRGDPGEPRGVQPFLEAARQSATLGWTQLLKAFDEVLLDRARRFLEQIRTLSREAEHSPSRVRLVGGTHH